MKNKNRKNRSYIKGKKKDIVEENLAYIKNSETAYLHLLNKFSHWERINCVEKGVLKPIDVIHEEIKQILKNKKII